MPPMPAGSNALLDYDFATRSLSMPEAPQIHIARIRGAILATSGSAPRGGGLPYEVYHDGASFVAQLR
ncbi:MAG: hypothetical protein ACKPKO_27590, partial [Candidatus Fonsibacter sp.]